MLCLPLKFLPGWLFGINADRVKAELREKIVRDQRECYDVLAEAFVAGRLTAETRFEDLLNSDTPAAQAYKMAAAIMEMAKQLLPEAQLDSRSVQLAQHEQRLEEIESTLGDVRRFVTPDQAMEISQAIKTIAVEIQKRTKRNGNAKIYGQLSGSLALPATSSCPPISLTR